MSTKFAVLAAVIICSACSKSDMTNYDALKSKEPQCPDGAKVEYRPWGKNGLMAICKLDHGPFIAAENGRIVLEGENRMGKRSGKWVWLNTSGQVERTEIVDDKGTGGAVDKGPGSK